MSLFQAPEGESQPSTEVDLFVSTEKIMVLNTDLQVSLWGSVTVQTHSQRKYSLINTFTDLLKHTDVPILDVHVCESEREHFIQKWA